MVDYKRRAAPKRKNKKQSGNCSLWFFSGFIVGAFIMGLVWLKLGQDLAEGHIPGVTPPKPTATHSRQIEPEQHEAPQPRFDFYSILPEMEVVIPEDEIIESETPAKPATPPRPDEKPAAIQGVSYILQMGSFRKHADADRMKARLALIGIEAEIQKVSINNRDTYHRVRSGPYNNHQRLNGALKLAKENRISTLVIKLKK
ncbi:MAG: cell division protein [Gammaproteobacteria bacterium (ex Lamellibrachia satsuma)]|nr:MAG: cell division protein [Gammaproteobacteria bacterium (ex Lamellibrachia satsuma)]RRS30923.1 MAG: cell division protein [Gammaproteobacteria bacterium (ex Lamellibrachia satsuma)]RRS37161.1 MAG: cell division protein [Gammaproteobacteria bacterium (ex Lamellibrachia satsuma)]